MIRWQKGVVGATALVFASGAYAQTQLTYGIYGTPGLIEMPTAQSAPDGEFAVSFSHAGESLRNSLTFQVLPRLSGTFRYTRIDDWGTARFVDGYYDRSFDLRYRLWDEGTYRPAVAIGLQDFIGTGLYSAEYVAATKNIGPVQATVGLGWGRLGSYGGFTNPLGAIDAGFETRPTGFSGNGGQVEASKWFRGDAALFGGLAWAVNDKLTAKLEYSSDANEIEVGKGHFTRKSPLNFGVDYQIRPGVQLSAYSLYGSDFGVMASFKTNPKSGGAGMIRTSAPVPVLARTPGASQDLGWAVGADQTRDALLAALGPAMAEDGIILEGMELNGTTATIRVRNTKYSSGARVLGRTARALTNVLPASVETIRVVTMEKGLQVSTASLTRSALEQFENDFDGADKIFAATTFEDAANVDRRAGLNTDVYSDFTWRLGPYARASIFDPQNPLLLDLGLELTATWNPTPGVYLSGALQQRLGGNLGDSTRASNSVLPHVRSDANIYDRQDTVLDHLTASYLFRPGRNLYGRVTAGYLERMYGGVSAEVLWKPVNSRLAFGAEINAVKQRSYDDVFGFTPLDIDPNNTNTPTTDLGPLSSYGTREYETVTGHLSAYYAFDNGFHGQLDVGRYLAKDWGATITLDREFKNGWKVGAYATFTDVSADEFGEGSFDKGIRIEIPFDWQLGIASRRSNKTVIQPLLRDGGARLNVQDRLYEVIRDSHVPQFENTWDRFWR